MIRLPEAKAMTGLSVLTANHLSQVGADVLIVAGGGNTITLLNTDLADLDTADFIF